MTKDDIADQLDAAGSHAFAQAVRERQANAATKGARVTITGLLLIILVILILFMLTHA